MINKNFMDWDVAVHKVLQRKAIAGEIPDYDILTNPLFKPPLSKNKKTVLDSGF
jgi:hypothetical protein